MRGDANLILGFLWHPIHFGMQPAATQPQAPCGDAPLISQPDRIIMPVARATARARMSSAGFLFTRREHSPSQSVDRLFFARSGHLHGIGGALASTRSKTDCCPGGLRLIAAKEFSRLRSRRPRQQDVYIIADYFNAIPDRIAGRQLREWKRVITIILEEREFPSDRLINTRMEEFEPEVFESRDSEGHVTWRRVEPYRLLVRQSITEHDVGVGTPFPSVDLTYSYLFTIWQQDWTRDLDRLFFDPFPPRFVAYYVPMNANIDSGTVYTHAVSLYTLRVLEGSPVSGFRDGVVSTAEGRQQIVASSPLRGQGPSEGVGGPYFVEWTAWTDPPATIESRRSFGGGLMTIERRMTLERNAGGRAVAFYRPFPEPPPGREPTPEAEPGFGLPSEEWLRQIVESRDLDSARKAIDAIDERLTRLRQMREVLKRSLE